MSNEPIGKAYLVIDESTKRDISDGIHRGGLFIAEFDTLEEAMEFITKEDNPNFAIIGPKVN